jgi:hypothetical protein
MLYHDSHLVSAIHRMRQDEASEMAERARLMESAGFVRSSLLRRALRRALADVGGLLISAGERLQRRCAPVVSCAAETCQPYQLAR